MPVNITRMFGNSAARDHNNRSPFFQPTDEFVTIPAFPLTAFIHFPLSVGFPLLHNIFCLAVIGAGFLLSVLALTNGPGMFLLMLTVLYAFLSIRVDGASILS